VIAGAIVGLVFVLGCKPPPSVRIGQPFHGSFLGATAGAVLVSGTIADVPPNDVTVVVNGVTASIDTLAKTFSAIVTLDSTTVFQPIVAELTQVSSGKKARDRVVAIRGAGASEADALPEALAIRLEPGALDDIAPAMSAILQDQLDLAALLPTEPIEIDDATVEIDPTPPPSFADLTLALDPLSGKLAVQAVVDDVFVGLHVERNGLFDIDCDMTVRVATVIVDTHHQLAPSPDGERLDVVQVPVSAGREVSVTMQGISSTADCSASGWFIDRKERRIREAIQAGLAGAFEEFLATPDDGPAPIAAALADQLAAINVTGVTLPGLRSRFDAAFARVGHFQTALELALDVDVSPSSGILGLAAPAAFPRPLRPDPDLSRSLVVPSGTPPLATALPHEVALGLSFSGLNRLLMSETEMRRFEVTVSELGGEPLTRETLAPLLPELATLPAGTPLRIKIKPTLAPILTGAAGPHDELLEARIAHLLVSLVKVVTNANGTTSEGELLRAAVDAQLGIDLAIGDDGQLAASLGTVADGDLSVHVIANPLGTNQDVIEIFGPALLADQLPALVATTASFPLPTFLGLVPQGTNVLRNGGYLVLLANLEEAP
jgi:hypothetical protein